MEIPSLISDLAILLFLAGIASITFKKIHLPIILGYIVVGFFASPYLPNFFTVRSGQTMETWGEIGVIVMLFHIGLEFDFHKLMRIGSTALITAMVKMGGVMLCGYLFGFAIGLSQMNSLFLGAMLSISSTVVIQKCFEESNLAGEKYSDLVMGTLIMEDLFSVFIMLVLSTLAVSKNISGVELVQSLSIMGAYLVVWLILGIFFLPSFMNRIMPLTNREMTTALTLGICFVMAILAKKLGLSMELGAFLAGSLFAGTQYAEKVAQATDGVKNMFCVIFFLSTGMKVDPNIVITQWTSIVPIAVLAVVAKLIFAMLGMILSGQSLRNAIRSGLSLAPIGEFSYIIASLGIGLGVMDENLYPIIVAASILTILITPIHIRNSDRVYTWVRSILPATLVEKMEQYSSNDQSSEEKSSDWGIIIRQFFSRTLIYGAIMIASDVAGIRLVRPYLAEVLPEGFSDEITVMIMISLVLILFLRPMLHLHDTTFTKLWLERKANRPPLVVLIAIKLFLLAGILYYPMQKLFAVHILILFVFLLLIIFFVARTDLVAVGYLQLETRFLQNLNARTLAEAEEAQGEMEWLDEDINILSFFVPEDADYIGRALNQLAWGSRRILVVKIRRGIRHFLLPGGSQVINGGDKVYVVGKRDAIENLKTAFEIPKEKRIRTLREFMESDYPDTEHALACLPIHVTGSEPYCGKVLMNTNIQRKGHCLVLGIQKKGYTVIMPPAHTIIGRDDIIWIMGSNNNVGRLAAMSVHETKKEMEDSASE